MYVTKNNLLKYAIYLNAIYVVLLFLIRPDGINISNIVITSLLLLSVCLFLLLCYVNWNMILQVPKSSRIIFYLLITWSIIVIVRSFSLNLQDWLTNFGNVYMALAWFTPVLIIIGQKIENWRVIIYAIFFMFQLMVLVFLLFPIQGKSPTEWTWLLRPINFILLIGFYRYKLLHRLIILVALIVYISIGLKLDQRIEFVFLALVTVLLIINMFKQIEIKRALMKYIIIAFLLTIGSVFIIGYENLSFLMTRIVEFEDSRTFLFNEVFTDMSSGEKIYGRGSLGSYYSPFMERSKNYITYLGQEWWGDASDRITVEVGYLQMILKGGFILFILTMSLMLNATYLALFKSNNRFIKKLGLFILILTVLSLISFRPAFTPTFIILWIAIGSVLNKRNRLMTDHEMDKLISFK